MSTAIYAFSGDPITFGHIDIIKRSLSMFDKIIVAIGSHPEKKYLFSIEEREAMAKYELQKFADRIEVTSFKGLLVDFAKENCIRHIIRGVRSNKDFEYEMELNKVNKSQHNIETIILFTDSKFSHISSSAVKEIIKNGGDPTEYVSYHVKQKLELRILDQRLIGVTGEIGAGKSFFVQNFINYARASNWKYIPTNIDLDTIGRDILEVEEAPLYVNCRERLIDNFGDSIIDKKATNQKLLFIDRKKIASKIFYDEEYLEAYNTITKDPILFKMRRELRGKKGIIFINSALLIEGDLLSHVNNNVIFVTACKETRRERLLKRGYSESEVRNRMDAQFSIQKKLEFYELSVDMYKNGKHWIVENEQGHVINFDKITNDIWNL